MIDPLFGSNSDTSETVLTRGVSTSDGTSSTENLLVVGMLTTVVSGNIKKLSVLLYLEFLVNMDSPFSWLFMCPYNSSALEKKVQSKSRRVKDRKQIHQWFHLLEVTPGAYSVLQLLSGSLQYSSPVFIQIHST